MIGARGQRKGARFEREIARQLTAALGVECSRGDQRFGATVPDVDVPGWWPELKHGKRPSPRAALRQAEADSRGTGRVPFAVVKDDRQPAFVVVRLDPFVALLRAVMNGDPK